MRIFLATILIMLAVNLSAYTIKSIKYDGLVHMSESVALRMLKFAVGDTVNDEMLDKSVKAYFKQGYFIDAWVEIDDGVLT
ncbi:MAG: outer membrane protein assembly factor BamA, partial [Sulfurimonas sp.]|nr:outer membrane protein assembly factor BamA [Sulfurimonas sp.]